ncbi:MAG: anhydro-N-acetylmuramic acid kinase [Candidatus Latescibacterota bacterium]|nr:MAG: anhydro-N-acetylmuramic acid kinase [Candidatus Latescibacterota bacterium]
MLSELLKKKEFLAVGLMSGTSMDGVDAALVRMGAKASDSEIELIGFSSTPYPDELKAQLMEIAFGEQSDAEGIAKLHTSVAVSFSHGYFAACSSGKVDPKSVDFVGSHGQTVAHAPTGSTSGGEGMIAGTLQLGPPGMIAALTGTTTVGDFRSADVALGGQGAPLAPFADFLLRRSKTENRIILNIGGIANLTYLSANCAVDEVVAFDTGPGNMILDELYRVLYPDQGAFDSGGAKAALGSPSDALVDRFVQFPFFKQRPPKSAGHREFGTRFAWEFLSKAEADGLTKNDILSTAAALTTRSIGIAVREFIQPGGAIDCVYASGGGARNDTLMTQLADELSPVTVKIIDELGIPAEVKEAVDFAVLARETIMSRQNVIHRATGASKPTVLGTIAPGFEI